MNAKQQRQDLLCLRALLESAINDLNEKDPEQAAEKLALAKDLAYEIEVPK